MTKQPQHLADPFEVKVPAPSEMFLTRVVADHNIKAVERAMTGRQRRLTAGQLAKARTRTRQMQIELKPFFEAKSEWESARNRITELRIEAQQIYDHAKAAWRTLSPDARAAARARYCAVVEHIGALAIRCRQLQDAAAPLLPTARQYRALMLRIDEHKAALDQAKRHHALKLELAKECYDWQDILIERFSQLGYKHEMLRGKKHIVQRVKFTAVHITPDQVFLKLDSSFKAIFGFKSTLPQGVKVADLINPETCRELTASCQRQVTSRFTMTNGAWIIVNRLGTVDGILDYVTLKQILTRWDDSERDAVPLLLGVGEGRSILPVRLQRHPHILIGGSTGGGKSNLQNAIICTLIQKYPPQDIRLILVDMKEGTEFRQYENIPHLLIPVVKEVDDLPKLLARLEEFRRQRAQDFEKWWVRDIDEFNARVAPEKRIPRIVIVFDEYAAIKIKRDLEKIIQMLVMQLLNKGRSTGIHLILGTQNPSVDVLPGPSKANMALRIAGLMPTKAASTTILGSGEAASLPDVPGRMVALLLARKWQIQTPHVRPQDLQEALEAAAEWPAAPAIELPAHVDYVGFDEAALVELVMSELAGDLKASKLAALIRDSEGLSRRDVEGMVKTIVQRGSVDYEGEAYRPVRQPGNFYKLVKA